MKTWLCFLILVWFQQLTWRVCMEFEKSCISTISKWPEFLELLLSLWQKVFEMTKILWGLKNKLNTVQKHTVVLCDIISLDVNFLLFVFLSLYVCQNFNFKPFQMSHNRTLVNDTRFFNSVKVLFKVLP